ncbi:PepSY domain-containing protein [Nocardioides albidus]|uniref:PepSY domain-containing protein n=1 Tax=Nocardioides albidus TaxID=1517589 RepID=A0A5C4VR27_9ACTN|nr:PepSY-associated TM helix domain-containing protein [Nocardioides albidus]TNM38362.1 PepSY domain-containing protein [Nocardioides albidus]
MAQDTEQPAATPADRPRPSKRPEQVRRRLAATHRWTSLIVGGLLAVLMASGVPLLYGAESFRARNGDMYQPTHSATPLTAQQALEVARAEHPDFTAGNVISDHGIFVVADQRLNRAYGVDPGSGEITGSGHYYGGFQGFVENLHAFGLSSPRYPGYVPFMATEMPSFGLSSLEGKTLGDSLIGLLGVALVLLALSGLYLWWPGLRRLSSGFRARTGKSRYITHRELHKVIGILSLPFLLMWGLTGAVAKYPVIEQGLLAVTGGDTGQVKALNWDFASEPRDGAEEIGLDAAAKAALTVVDGRISNHTLPDPSDPASAYLFEISEPDWDPYDGTMLAGNDWVYVDKYDASHTKVVWSGHDAPLQNRVYEELVYPSHFGWYHNGWVRLVWAVFGLAPLFLLTTGVVSWTVRHRRKRAREAARTAATATA